MKAKSGWHRKIDRLLRELGYEFSHRDSKTHFVYEHVTGRLQRVPCSPSDWRSEANLLATLRRHHPDSAVLQRPRKSPQPKHRSTHQRDPDAELRAALRQAQREAQDRVLPVFNRPKHTSCIACGRRWLSDLDPSGRSCPRCGGEVVLGRLADTTGLRKAA